MFELPDFEKFKPKKLEKAIEESKEKLGVTVRDSVLAFENAIEQGIVNVEEYMYMHTIDGKDFFKHQESREYIKVKMKELEDEKV